MFDSGSATASRDGRRLLLLEVTGIALLAFGVRLIRLGHAPYLDELNHLLAARSLLENGTLRILDGNPYVRAKLFTYLVAAFFRLFGESLVVSRLPAVLGGVALVAAVFRWVRSEAGRTAAWTAGLLICFDPVSLYLSQQCRFYTLQALFLWIGAVSLYRIGRGGIGSGTTTRHAITALVAFLLALHMQILSVVGITATCLWFFAAIAPRVWRALGSGKARALFAGALVIVAAFALLAAWRIGVLRAFWEKFRYSDLWAASAAGDPRYYHWRFLDLYPTLWTLLPILAAIAILTRPSAGSFCAVLFGVSFLIQSVAAWKSERYLFYATPMFFSIIGISMGALLPRARALLTRGVEALFGAPPGGRAPRAATALVIVVSALFLAAGNGAVSTTWHMMVRSDAEWPGDRLYRGEADWRLADPFLLPYAQELERVIVSSSDLKPLFYLGRIDYILSLDMASEDTKGSRLPEFTRWWKVGRPLFSKASSLEHVVEMHPSGLVVVEDGQWRKSWGVSPDVADYIEANMMEIELPVGCRIHAFVWGKASS